MVQMLNLHPQMKKKEIKIQYVSLAMIAINKQWGMVIGTFLWMLLTAHFMIHELHRNAVCSTILTKIDACLFSATV